MEALWRLDVTFASVLAAGREKMVSRIKLAWWREALERLDQAPPPPEPVLQALAAHVLPLGITGAALAAMEEGWAVLASDEPPDAEALALYASARGAGLFRLSARMLGARDFAVESPGALWALVDLARHSAGAAEAKAALAAAPRAAGPSQWPRALRPLGMLAMLARRDLERRGTLWERPGSPARMLRMFRHRLTGF